MGEFIFIVVEAVISFFVGKTFEKVQNKRGLIAQRAAALIALVRKTSDDAQRYYSSQMDDRDRQGETVLMTANMGRVSNDLNRLGENAGGLSKSCLSAWMSYHRAVTGGPFASDKFDPVAANDPRITTIQDTEDRLIEEIEAIEDNS